MGKTPRKSGHKTQQRMARDLDRMARFEEFENTILPQLRDDLSKGMSSRDMAAKYSRFAMARLISIALTDENVGLAKGASKEVVEFGDGKATEKKEVSHRLAKLDEKQLDALLLTEASDTLGEDDEESEDRT